MLAIYNNIEVPKNIDLSDVYDFIDSGNPDNAPKEIVAYLDALEKVRSMKQRPKYYATKQHVINHLIKVNGLSRYLANKIHDDAVEYFYLEDSISKQARRNLYAEQQDEDIALARLAATSLEDLEKISKMRERAYKFRNLDQPDIDDFPKELFEKPFKLYTLNPEDVGIPKADRRELAKRIEEYKDLSELEKQILKREASILPHRIFLEPHEDPRNDS